MQGKVIAVLPESDKVLVEGVNRIKKHTKVGQSTRGAKTGGIVTQEAPIHVSNVMLVDPLGQPPDPRRLPPRGRDEEPPRRHLVRDLAFRARLQAHR